MEGPKVLILNEIAHERKGRGVSAWGSFLVGATGHQVFYVLALTQEKEVGSW